MFVSVPLPPPDSRSRAHAFSAAAALRCGWRPGARTEGPRGAAGGPAAAPPGAAGRPRGVGRAATRTLSSAVAPNRCDFISESSDDCEAPRVFSRRRRRGPGTRRGKTRGTGTERACKPAPYLSCEPEVPPQTPPPPPPSPHPPTLRARVVKGKGKAIAPKERRGKGGNKCPNAVVSTLQASFDK